jgi:hypothetical protein
MPRGNKRNVQNVYSSYCTCTALSLYTNKINILILIGITVGQFHMRNGKNAFLSACKLRQFVLNYSPQYLINVYEFYLNDFLSSMGGGCINAGRTYVNLLA